MGPKRSEPHHKRKRESVAALQTQVSAERAARERLEHRQVQLEAAADLARVISPLIELKDVLTSSASHLYEGLGLDFVGIYLVDEFDQWAVLRAGAGALGAELLAHGYQVNLEQASALNLVLREKQAILLDHGVEARNPNLPPLLPITVSGVVIPLYGQAGLLGFWTGHSDKLKHFSSEDLPGLTLIGDNLAYAVENVERVTLAVATARGLERAQQSSIREAWAGGESQAQVVYSQQADTFGRDNFPTSAVPDTPANGKSPTGALSVPITLRGQQIGTVDLFDSTQEREWSESEKALAVTVIEQMALSVENARLFEVTQKRAQETSIVNEMAQVLSGELNPNRLYEIVYSYLPRLLPADAFIVWLYDETTGLVTRPALFDMGERYPESMEPVPPSGNMGRVIAGNDAIIKNLTREDYEIERKNTEAIIGSSAPSASLAFVPLRVGNRLRGVLSAQTYTFNAYGEPQTALLTAVANQLATALESAQLFGQTQEVLAETQTLYEISARLNASNNLQEALEAASGPAIVQGALGTSLLRVHVNEDGEPSELEYMALWPRSSEQSIPLGTRLGSEFMGSEVEWITDPNEPVLVENLAADPRVKVAAIATSASANIGSTALLPLKIGTRWIGVLNFNWQEPRTFAPRDVRLFRSIMAQAATVLDNRALFEQTQVALEQAQQALAQVQEAQNRLNLQYQTADILARTSTFDNAADQLLENTCRSLNWQMGEYWALDGQTDRVHLTHAWHAGTPELDAFTEEARGLAFGSGEGLAGQAWAEGRPVWKPDLSSLPSFKQGDKAGQVGLKSAFAVPLSSEVRVFGVMIYYSTYQPVMDDTLMATMVGVGNQIGQFLERRRAEEAVRQQNTYLTALHDTTLGLIRRLNIDELLQSIIARAGELVGTQHGYVHLIEPSGTELRMRAGIGIYEDFVGTRVKPGQGLAGTVWRNEEPIVVDDYRYWHGRLPMVDRDVLRAVVGVPLRSAEQTVGVLGLASLEDGRRFGVAQIEALNRFAELAAIALDNAQLYNASQQALEQSRSIAQREKASAEIADRLYAAPDVQTVLRTAAEELRQLTGSRRATVRLNLAGFEDPAAVRPAQRDNGA